MSCYHEDPSSNPHQTLRHKCGHFQTCNLSTGVICIHECGVFRGQKRTSALAVLCLLSRALGTELSSSKTSIRSELLNLLSIPIGKLFYVGLCACAHRDWRTHGGHRATSSVFLNPSHPLIFETGFSLNLGSARLVSQQTPPGILLPLPSHLWR